MAVTHVLCWQIIVPILGWRWLIALSSLPSLMLLLLYGVMPESPRYLCMIGRTTDAHNVLVKVAQMNQASLPHGTLISEHSERSTSMEESLLLDEYETATSRKGGLSSFFLLFSPKLFKQTMLLWVVFFGNTFSYYGLVLLTSELSNRKGECSHSDTANHNHLYRDVFVTSLAGSFLP